MEYIVVIIGLAFIIIVSYALVVGKGDSDQISENDVDGE